jgi:hypothetical protein
MSELYIGEEISLSGHSDGGGKVETVVGIHKAVNLVTPSSSGSSRLCYFSISINFPSLLAK